MLAISPDTSMRRTDVLVADGREMGMGTSKYVPDVYARTVDESRMYSKVDGRRAYRALRKPAVQLEEAELGAEAVDGRHQRRHRQAHATHVRRRDGPELRLHRAARASGAGRELHVRHAEHRVAQVARSAGGHAARACARWSERRLEREGAARGGRGAAARAGARRDGHRSERFEDGPGAHRVLPGVCGAVERRLLPGRALVRGRGRQLVAELRAA